MSNARPLVMYHASCLDGFAAAYAAYRDLGDTADYMPLKYGDPLHPADLADLVDGRDVYILDYSFTEATLPALKLILSRADYVVWLDHHASSFKSWCGDDYLTDEQQRFMQVSHSENEDGRCYILLDNTKSGACLAWEFFQAEPGGPVPHGYRLIDDYDRWQFKMGDTRAFQKALWARAPWAFHDWDSMYEAGAFGWNTAAHNALIMEGLALQRAHEQRVTAAVNGGAMLCHLTDGYLHEVGKAANCPPDLTSDVGHELANMSGTFGLCWYLGYDGKVNCSLRSNGDYNVAVIAEAFGGGGHKNAAGFITDIDTLTDWLVFDATLAHKAST